MKSALRKCAAWLLLLSAPALHAATPALPSAPSPAIATIVDGEAVLLRDTSRLALAEGVRLAADDIVETTAKARFVRLEFSDGVILDLGPESRLLLSPRLAGDRNRAPARVHLLRGVAKLSLPRPMAANAGLLSSPVLDLAGVTRSTVLIVQPPEAQVFAESGEVALQERPHGKAGDAVRLKGSEFYARGADAKTRVAARPTPAFIQRLPRPFLDTLPARAAHFASRAPEPKPLGEIGYAEAEPWIDADGLRAHFAARWKALAQNPDFREGVAAHMAAHPEWDRILFPEKYQARPAAPATPTPADGYGRSKP